MPSSLIPWQLNRKILDNESVFREAFRDELMCMMHFQTLVLLSAEARLQREASYGRHLLQWQSRVYYGTARDPTPMMVIRSVDFVGLLF